MTKLDNLEDLFHHQLKDLFNAEMQLINTLPVIMREASNKDLKKVFANHVEETKVHKKRLRKIGKDLNIELKGETCQAIKGLIKETKLLIFNTPPNHVRDAGIIANIQRIEHYEISAYGTAIQLAKGFSSDGAIELLGQTLDEEKEADRQLNKIAQTTNGKTKVSG